MAANKESKKTVEIPSSQKTFVPDYKYVSAEDIAKLTVTQLAKLEADLHSLRVLFIANDENPDVMVGNGRTLKQEIDSITALIEKIETYFVDVIE